jgi:hypothetical protein
MAWYGSATNDERMNINRGLHARQLPRGALWTAVETYERFCVYTLYTCSRRISIVLYARYYVLYRWARYKLSGEPLTDPVRGARAKNVWCVIVRRRSRPLKGTAEE